MTDQSPKKQLIDRGPDNLLFWWLHFIHFIRWEWKFHKLSQIYTESDKLSFYKAPPGHLIRTKTVQTWFLRVCFSQFVLVKPVIIKRNCLYCKDLQSKCTLYNGYSIKTNMNLAKLLKHYKMANHNSGHCYNNRHNI